jgi:hypothetical protein
MSKCFQFAFSSPVVGMEEEFQRWYSDDHLPHSVKLSAVDAGQRFSRQGETPWPAGKHENLVIWELAGDPAEAIKTLLASHGTTDMPISPAIDMSSVQPPTMTLLKRMAGGADAAIEDATRGSLLLAFLNPVEGEGQPLQDALVGGGLDPFSRLDGVAAVSLWTLTEAQLRGSARKYQFLLMFEAADSQALVGALTENGDLLKSIAHSDPERMFAAVYSPLTERVAG